MKDTVTNPPATNGPNVVNAPSAAKKTVADVLPLSPLQEGLLFHALLADTGIDVYTVSTGLDLRGDLDPAAVRAAGQGLLDRHANLRAGFRRTAKGAAVAVIATAVTLPWQELDLSARPDPEAELAGFLATERERPFDLARPPLLRFTLIRMGPASHRLILTHHHILLDGWSTPLLVREFFALYQGLALPTVRPYRDYLAWLSKWDAEGARQAWRSALAGVEPTRVAAADPLREAVGPGQTAVTLPAGLSDRLLAVARERGLTVNTLVQTAWALLLGALTGQDEVVFGITVSGRPAELPGVESMIGLFINTVPVRITAAPAESLGAVLDRVQHEQSGLIDHQYLALSEIQRLAGAGELFDTLVVFENYPFEEDGWHEPAPGLRLAAMDDRDATHYPLVLVAQADAGLELDLRYRPDLFDAEAAEAIAGRLLRILTGIAGPADLPVAAIDLLSPAERREILHDWNPDRAAGPLAQTVPDFFDQAVAAGPDRIALVLEEVELTYAELDTRANRLAHRLIRAGAGPDQVVAVALPRSIDLIVALLAVLKAGAAYLAVDLDYPADRIDYMLTDARPAVLVTTTASLGRLPRSEGTVLLDTEDPDQPHDHRPDPGRRPLTVLDAAYVIYTSGSTGRPKGVVLSHEGAAKLIATATGRIGLTRDSRVLQFASPSFDVAFFELCMGLLIGARLVVTPAERRVSDRSLVEYLVQQGITHAALPPALLANLPAEVDLPAGITVLVGTEVVPPELVERFGGDRVVFNAYGPTEVTVNSTLWRAEPGRPGPVPIGWPDPQARAYVLDAALRPVPAGVPGELYLAGKGLARGYLGRPALTAERFVADPFAAEFEDAEGPGPRMYRTGDLVRWSEAGVLEFLGRTDDQVKIRGFRIEPGEIEAVIVAQPGVRRAVVIVREDRPGQHQLVAYLLADQAELPALREQVAARLPEYMVPSAFIVLDRLPMTANGKLDRAALPAPTFAAAAGGRAPRTPRETLLRDLFTDLLGLPGIGIDDDFFALGGDSIVAMQLVSRARRSGLKITPRQVFQRRSVAGLAAVAGVVGDADGRIPAQVALVAIEDDEAAELAAAHPGLTEVLPLSPLQEGLMFHASFDPASAGSGTGSGTLDVYTVQSAFHLSGDVDPARLQAAGQALLDRHANLRAGFRYLRSGRPVAVVAGSVPLPWSQVDLSGLSEPDRAATLARLLDATRAQTFDLTRPPLLRLALIRTGPQAHTLVLTHHHLLLDGWSRAPLMAELTALYAAGSDRPQPPLPPLPPVVPYRNYLAWLAALDPAAGRAAWRQALAGLDEPTRLVPADPGRAPLAPSSHLVELPAALTAALVGLARSRGLTVNTLVQAAWGVLLGRLTGREDVVFGATVAGRPPELDGVESMIGLFINTVPVRVRCAPADPIALVLSRLQDQQAALIEYQHLGLAEIQREAGLGELFDSLVVVENYPDEPSLPRATVHDHDKNISRDHARLHAPELAIVASEGRDATHYPLTWAVDPGERLALEAEYRPDLFTEPQIARIGDGMVRIFEAMVADPEQPVARIDLLDAGQRHQILNGWNDSAHDVPKTTLPQLFRAQVERTPEAEAVRFEGESHSYAELDKKVGRLAQVLIERGVQPGDTVAVAIARSFDLVVALLAVHRAGAAYLPLDLSLPTDRIEFMLADARPALVLTTSASQNFSVPTLLTETKPIRPENKPAAPNPHSPAYLIYTSGSTGRPKGVVVSHQAIVNRLLWMQHEYGLAADDRVLQKTPAGFDVSVWEFFWPLISGATLVLARPEGHQDPAYLAGLIRTERITTAHFVPSMLQAFVAEPTAATAGTSLRRVICSGEALPAELAARFSALLAVPLHNLYGPTEAAVDVTAWRYTAADQGSVPIGRPVWNTRVYVLDAGLRPVPAGVQGELYLAGAQLAQGYLGRAGLSAERFVADPFVAGTEDAESSGQRMYRTGDLVQWSDDGVLEFLGRTDDQVKIRGFRIELGEIETAIAMIEAIEAAVVVVREDRPGRRRLVAYLIADPALELDAVRAELAQRLPEYMVPAAFVRLDALPVTVNGKLNRSALPAPDFATATGDAQPTTEQESTLAGLFADVLGLERVGVDDDFFALGGDSIVAMRLVSLARRAGLGLSPRQVFQHRSVAGLAEVAVALGQAPTVARTELLQLTADERDELLADGGFREVLPLTPLQTGLLFHAAFDSAESGDLDVYTVQLTFELDGPLDAARLRSAGQALLERHANLRAGYRYLRSGRAVAVIRDGVELPWSETDLTGLDPDQQESGWLDVLADEGRRFDVASAPLLRLGLVRLGAERSRLVLTHQHLLLDGWSRGPLMAQLSALYAGSASSIETPDFRDYLSWLAGQDAGAAETAWQQALTGLAEPTRLVPADPQRAPAVPQLISHELPAALTARLAALGRARGLTMNTLVQAAWAIVLGQLTGSADVVFGATVSGRPPELDGAEAMIGLFINTVPVRARLDPAEPVGALLERLQAEQADLLAHQHRGLSDIQRRAGLGDLFDTLLVFENYPDTEASPQVEGPMLSVVDAGGRDATHYPFVWVVDPGERLRLGAEYRADLFDAAAVERTIAAMTRVFELMVDQPHLPVGQIDTLAPADRTRILHTWNNKNPRDHARLPGQACMITEDDSLVELFAAQVERTPDALAVVGPDRSYRFAELDEQSNRLARLLIARGAGPERLIALALPRSAQTLLAILAVLKSGAAYLPIDPEYPPAHIETVLSDAEPVLMLTTAALAGTYPAAGQMLLDRPETAEQLAAQPGTPLTSKIHPDHPAYVIYTSGSTGRPKGVLITHRTLVNLFAGHRETLYRPAVAATGREQLNVGHAWSFSFDASWQPQLWMLDGHTVHIITDDVRRDPDRLVATIKGLALDFLELTPSHYGQLLDSGLLDGESCPLTVIGVGGEAVPDALWTRLAALAETGTTAFNLYGPTESTVDALVARLDQSKRPQVGRPVAGTRAYVLDAALRPVPPGVTGELYLAGGGLARGYLNRAALSAERFVADPFAAEAGAGPGERMYRTGDLAAWTAEGRLVLAGRVDDQVKVRGFRIELAEVEAALDRQDAVGQAVVVVREDRPGIKQLVGYVVAATGFVPEPADLRRGVAAVLPDHMVPSAFVVLDRIPLLANGKLDRNGLPAPERSATAGGRAPATAREKVLADVVAGVLGLPGIGVDDDFFALGGDSIVAMQLVSRLRGAGLKVSPREVFQHRTVEQLAAVAVEVSTGHKLVDDSIGVMPVTPVMHWLRGVDGPIDGFNQSAVLQVPADLDLDRLTTAIQAVVQAHSMLRARLLPSWELEVPGGAYPVGSLIRRVDVTGQNAEQLWASVAEHSAAAQQRLDPANTVMLQAVWFDAGPDAPGRLLVLIHHLVVDGVSWRILIPDLAAAYAEAGGTARVEVMPVDTSFRRWAQQLAQRAADPAREAELPLWQSVLSNGGRLPVLRELDPAVDLAATTQELTLVLPTERTAPLLTRVPAAFGATVNDVLLTALALAVADLRRRYTDQADRRATVHDHGQKSRRDHARLHAEKRGVLVALEGHGREEELVPGADLSRTVGWFTNVFPVHLDPGELDLDEALAGGPAAAAAITRIRDGLRALPDNGMGFGLLRYLNPRTAPELADFPLPQIEFNYMGRIDYPETTDWSYAPESEAVASGADDAMPESYSLIINAQTEDRPQGPELSVSWAWPEGVLSDEQMRDLGETWFRALDALTTASAGHAV